jgi:DnaJ-class molecular chaperone
VDYRSLPEDLQIRLVKIVNNYKNVGFGDLAAVSPENVGPHATLFVLDTAPWEVVTAAYKALALLHHPDHGGSTEAFIRIQKAYDTLKSQHKA